MLIRTFCRASLVLGALTLGWMASADDGSASLSESKNLFEVLDLGPGRNTRDHLAPKRIYIWVAERVDRASFRAALNGRDVTDKFDLSESGIRLVKLPFGHGRNRLEISARGSEFEWHSKDDAMSQDQGYDVDFVEVRAPLFLPPERIDEAVEPVDPPGRKN